MEAELESDFWYMVRADPYFREGLCEDAKVHAFKERINTWHNDSTDQ
jgi:hypothetical protein